MTSRLAGRATAAGTARYADRFNAAASGHFRPALGLTLGSVGMGTYLGNADAGTDEAYAQAVADAVERGCNVIDTAANYRFQRSERAIGEGLRRLAVKGYAREEILICTKGGYIPFDGDIPDSPREYFTETFIKPGIATPQDLVAGMHCMTPKYIRHQLECSRRNIGLDTIDVYYIHNPESQFQEISRDEFDRRIRAAFEALEKAADEGLIGAYGCATWNAFRIPPESPEYMSLEALLGIARQIAGDRHRFRVIQLPYNISMPEAVIEPTQGCSGARLPAFDAADKLGLTVLTSVPIFQGRLTHDLPDDLRRAFPGLTTDAQRAIQFVRSTPGVAAPLVGMSSPAHVAENLALVEISPAAPEGFRDLI